MPKYRQGSRTHQMALMRLAGRDAPDGAIREGSALHRRLMPAQYRLGTHAYDVEMDRRLANIDRREARAAARKADKAPQQGVGLTAMAEVADGSARIAVDGKAEAPGSLFIAVRGSEGEEIVSGVWDFGARKTAKVLARDAAKDMAAETIEATADDDGNITVAVKSDAETPDIATAEARVEPKANGDT